MLLGNGFARLGVRTKQFGGTAVSGANPSVLEGRWSASSKRNLFAGEGITDNKASVPSGNRHPAAWVMARKNGAMSSRNEAVMTVSQSANGAMGLPGDGTADFTIDFATATGGLISSGTGTASFAITSTATVLATRSGDGSASFAITTNTPLLGALGWVTAEGAFSVSATMQSYARGYMTGSTVDTSTIVNANIVSVNGYSVTGNGQTGSEWGPAS